MKETLEEAAEKYAEYNEFLSDRPFEFKRDKVAFICGAKWQAKRSYSEEDLESAWASSEQNMRFAFSSSQYKNIKFKQWFEQFKKK